MLEVAFRYAVLAVATAILLLIFWKAVVFLWKPSDQSAFAVKPFVIVDPAGDMTSGEAGLARMLIARVNELQDKLDRSNSILERARGEKKKEEEVTTYAAGRQGRLNSFSISGIFAEPDKLDLTFQGIDIGGFLSWFAKQVRPKQKSLTFTISRNGETFGAAGDVSALGIEGVPTIWIEPDRPSVHAIVDELALRLVSLRVTEKNAWMTELDRQTFRELIETVPRTEEKQEPFITSIDRKRHFEAIFAFLSKLTDRFENLQGLTIITAETARLSGRFEEAIVLLEVALAAETARAPADQNADLLQEIEGALTQNRSALNAGELELTVTAALRLPIDGPPGPALGGGPPTPLELRPSASVTITRPLVSELERAASNRFKEVFTALKAKEGSGGYDSLASLYAPYGIHVDPKFLPWNRAYLLHVEKAGRALDPDFTLACWDAPRSAALPALFTEGGESNGLFAPGRGDPESWSARRIKLGLADLESAAMGISSWSGFARAIEQQVSNLVHVAVGGQMARVDSAASDPLFFAHRCNIDRLWARWQAVNDWPASDPSLDAGFLDEPLEPFGLTVAEVLDISKLGYAY